MTNTIQKKIDTKKALGELKELATGVPEREFGQRTEIIGIGIIAATMIPSMLMEKVFKHGATYNLKDITIICGSAFALSATYITVSTLRRMLRTNKFTAQMTIETKNEVGQDTWAAILRNARAKTTKT